MDEHELLVGFTEYLQDNGWNVENINSQLSIEKLATQYLDRLDTEEEDK